MKETEKKSGRIWKKVWELRNVSLSLFVFQSTKITGNNTISLTLMVIKG